MKILESAILIIAILGGVSWTILSTRDGYTQTNAMIVARSIDISSTIDGEVKNTQLAVGSHLQANDVLVTIRNTRVDYSRVIELTTKINYLKSEITNAKKTKEGLQKLLNDFEKRSTSYSVWLKNDLHLKNEIKKQEYLIAVKKKHLMIQELKRLKTLAKKKLISVVEFQKAQLEAEIANNQEKIMKAELTRSQQVAKAVANKNIASENGDASYWQQNIDSLTLRILESNQKIKELAAQLTQFSEQEKVEQSRLKTDFIETHRAPFTGVVNAVYVTKGAHVKSGTVLMQILDCSNPVVIVPIPDAYFSDFVVGQKVTINPIDSEESLIGSIQYISSGPLISQDKTIALQQELTAKGNHAVIRFESNQLNNRAISSCDTTRRATVTIPIHSLYDSITEWMASFNTNPSSQSAALTNWLFALKQLML